MHPLYPLYPLYTLTPLHPYTLTPLHPYTPSICPCRGRKMPEGDQVGAIYAVPTIRTSKTTSINNIQPTSSSPLTSRALLSLLALAAAPPAQLVLVYLVMRVDTAAILPLESAEITWVT